MQTMHYLSQPINTDASQPLANNLILQKTWTLARITVTHRKLSNSLSVCRRRRHYLCDCRYLFIGIAVTYKEYITAKSVHLLM